MRRLRESNQASAHDDGAVVVHLAGDTLARMDRLDGLDLVVVPVAAMVLDSVPEFHA